MRRTVTAALVGALALAVTAVPAGRAVDDPIQPGDFIHAVSSGTFGPNRCTLGFAFDGHGAAEGEVFFATAAHCVGGVGAGVRLLTGPAFGTVAFRDEPGIPSRDVALVRVRAADLPRVNASVKGHPGVPVGVADPDETATGDPVRFVGQANGYDTTLPTQEQRVGVLVDDGPSRLSILAPAGARDGLPLVNVSGPVVTGDDGAPVVHIPSGTAAGLVGWRVADAAGTFCCYTGPTVPRIITLAAAGGISISLRAAPTP